MSTPQATSPSPNTFRKIALSLGLIVVSGVYAVWQNVSGLRSILTQNEATPAQSYKEANAALLQTLAEIQNALSSSTPVSQTPTMLAPMQPVMGGMMSGKRALFFDGLYTGTPADAYYGTVQVKAIVTGGRIADVQFLQYPDSRQNSRMINDQAMPLLTQEAITAQSAQVDGVSGATFTSQAFQQSLASALVLAKN
ncbi:MAG: FMN-binding protein [Candidatus Paceibacterota bacterium]|jgi:uncharacterized protein with FMN-binding domain